MPATLRELDSRTTDGITVTLYWDPDADRVLLSVFDSRSRDSFDRYVPSDEARVAFDHPFAYKDEPETDVTDTLANIMHYCEAKGVDYARAQREAREHYLAEVEEAKVEAELDAA